VSSFSFLIYLREVYLLVAIMRRFYVAKLGAYFFGVCSDSGNFGFYWSCTRKCWNSKNTFCCVSRDLYCVIVFLSHVKRNNMCCKKKLGSSAKMSPATNNRVKRSTRYSFSIALSRSKISLINAVFFR